MEIVLIALGVAAVVAVGWFFLSSGKGSGGGGGLLGGASFPPGTRAFEAEMSLKIITQMIEAREVQLGRESDDAKKATLTKQIDNLRKQAVLHRATVEARDLSPGKMSIGVNPDSDTVD
jgi:hypothetical protein